MLTSVVYIKNLILMNSVNKQSTILQKSQSHELNFDIQFGLECRMQTKLVTWFPKSEII